MREKRDVSVPVLLGNEEPDTLTREELAELREQYTGIDNHRLAAIPIPTLDTLLAMAERCAEAEAERDRMIPWLVDLCRTSWGIGVRFDSARRYLRQKGHDDVEERELPGFIEDAIRAEERERLQPYLRHREGCPRRLDETYVCKCEVMIR